MSAESSMLDELEHLLRYATDAPWAADVREDGRAWIDVPDEDGHAWGMHGSPADARLVAALRNAAPSLLVAARERDEFFARLTRREADWAERQAETATIGDTGVCRTCALDIFYETVEEPGYLPRTGWSDRFRRDALVCFKAVHYRHVPLVGRERGIWDAAMKRATEERNS